jgi:phospholipase C
MPTSYPLYKPTSTNDPTNPSVADKQVTATCAQVAAAGKTGLGCGDYAVNTTQPPYQPGTADANRLPPQSQPTIGDRLSAPGVDWAWYSGGSSNADGDKNAPGWTNGAGPICSDPNIISGATYPN